ncbi:hypothetical protein CAC42_5014 [Sphaceloma murrayae]|uniref:Zn(2)-C6 fungal-type domain-containing protein n=1 Tax=Sphaceloma murrayae TaxID=2082308 RepID=A0A2K1QQ52_9PEZI|nr:hypothetical protein CAC42_5014 [Sphaceloma murrayae]
MAREPHGLPSRSAEDQPAPKRRRIAVACNACRLRKSRCNGAYPKCSNCEGLGFECNYEASESSSNVIVRKEQMTVLEDRLKVVEKQLALHTDFLKSHWNTCVNGPSETAPLPAYPVQGVPAVPAADQTSDIAEEAYDTTATDGMGISFVDENDFAFYGPSSNIYFMRAIIRAVTPSSPSSDALTPSGMSTTVESILKASRTQPSNNRKPRSGIGNLHTLPPEPEMRAILTAYFSNTNLIYPVIHEPTFMKDYNEAKTSGFAKVRMTWLGLLHMMIAMAISIGKGQDSIEDRFARSFVYYDRGARLCQREMLRGTTIETVQFLLVMSLYLQGAQKSVQTFTIHGLAVKACFSLGLHSTQSAHRFSAVENEVRKRTFYTCVLLDRTMSFSFGRPPMIPQDYIRLPLPQDWPPSDDSLSLSTTASHLSSSFFSSSTTLHNLAYQIIKYMYGCNIDPTADESQLISQVLNLDQELDQWCAAQPFELRLRSLDDGPSDDTVETRMRNILTLRFLNLKLMAHRPFLSRMLHDMSRPTARSNPTVMAMIPMLSHVMKPCIDSARATVDLVHSVLEQEAVDRPMLGAWWFTLHYLFSCSLVFAANMVVNLNLTSVEDNNDMREYMSKTSQCLERLDGDNVILSRCKQYVNRLMQTLVEYERNLRTEAGLQLGTPGSPQASQFDAETFNNSTMFNYFPGLDMPELTGLSDIDIELANFFAA